MKIIKEQDTSKWLEIINKDPFATYFHTPNWYEIAKSYGVIDSYNCFLLNIDGIEYRFPIATKKLLKGLSSHSICSPFGTFGGVITENRDISIAHKGLIINFLLRHKNITFRDNPYRPLFTENLDEQDFTQAIFLDDVDLENVYKGWSKGHRSAAKKSLREGVTIRLAMTQQDWDDYYDIYLDSLSRWGEGATSTYRKELFSIIREKDGVRLWLAFYEGKAISGCLCFYHNKHIAYWHGAGLADYFRLSAVHALQAHIITDAKESDFDYYDLNPSGGHKGVIKFKKGFNTRILPNTRIRKDETIISAVLNKIRR